MPDYNLSQLLERAASSYSPDTSSKALAKVKARANHHRRSRMLACVVLVVGVVVLSLALVLTVSGEQSANAVRYLRISPATRNVDLSATSPKGLSDIYFADSSHGIGLEQHCVLSATTNTVCSLKIVRTNNAGRTWKPVGQTLHVTYPDSRASYPFIDFATNGKDGWIYGSKTFVTHDGGISFEQDGLGGVVMDLSIEGSQTWALSRPCPPGIAGCRSTVLTTATAGGPWKVDRAAPMIPYPYLQLLLISRSDVFLAAQATDATLYGTTDGGASWQMHRLPAPCDQLLQLTGFRAQDLWALCSGPAPSHSQSKALYHSDDGGSTWKLAATSSPQTSSVGRLPESGIVTLLTSVAPDRLIIAFDEGAPIASTDGGRTWNPQGLPALGGVARLSFTDAQHGWAVLYPDATLYRTTDGGIHWTKAGS